MAALYEPDLGTAFYRSNDPIKNLKLRLFLERTTSSNVLSPVAQPEDLQPAHGSEHTMGLSRDKEEVSLHWQQKVFSQREVTLYADESNCGNIIEQKYHKDVTNILSKGKPTNRVFTYVDHDDCRHLTEGVVYMTTSNHETPTAVSNRMANVRRRRVAGRKTDKSIPKLNVIDTSPSDDHKSRHHLLPPPVQTMYIMADLSPKDKFVPFSAIEDEVVLCCLQINTNSILSIRPDLIGISPTIEDEVVLCCLQINTNSILSIRPDFNKHRKPYVAELHTRGGDIYDYRIEDISKTMNRQELDREQKMYKELYVRHTEFLQACVGSEFDMPQPDVLKLMVYGEMESAKNFDYDNLYIHFFVDLPKDWTVRSGQQLSWVTETCATKEENGDNVAYFGFPFNFELFHKKNIYDDNSDDVPRFPMLLIEVLSLDSWSRFRTEGYAYLTIPTHAGRYHRAYDCWRPIGNSLSSELRRFFIGGSPELEDMTYTVVPCTFQGSHISKYAFRTETTGSVTLNLNVMMQSRSFMEHKAIKKTRGSLIDAMGKSAVQANVLEAFKRAHENMVQSRDNAALDLLKES